ncbi:MAG: AsmA-like C-terminal region-containing protein [Balneolaceae bacterium]
MKLFLKILAGVVIFITVLLIALNLYLTDERLKSMILPEVREIVGTEVQVENMSLTFFKTFPRLGVELDKFLLPDPNGEPVATFEELLVGVELFPLMRNEISISELIMNQPVLDYHVLADSTSNIDFLLDLAEEPEEPQEEEGYSIAIPNFSINSATINYRDDTGNLVVTMSDLDADISLQFADLIESTIEAELGSLSAMVDSVNYVDDLSLSLSQTSTIDLENEEISINEGVFSIRGLALNMNGSVTSWSSDPVLDINFSSSSENFGEILRLAPPEYDEYLADLESRGSLLLEGSVSGIYTEENLPDFNMILTVVDGYLKNPELPDAIEDIQIELSASNDLVTIQEIQATAAGNSITASGSIDRPLEDDGVFSMNVHGDLDLATVSRFYPIEEFEIQQLSGILATNMSAEGSMDNPEEASFSGNFSLRNGMLQYADVSQPIEGINANVQASQDLITIRSMEFTAATNEFSMSGTINSPLNENNRAVDLAADLNFDLSTIKDFYPIDEDTLQLRGQLVANFQLQGRADPDQIEQVIQNGTINLQNGYIRYEEIGEPLEDITLVAEVTGTRLNIREGYLKTGENELSVNGAVLNYLSDEPRFDLALRGDAKLSDVSSYYSMEPWIQELLGNANLNLNAEGPAGDPQQISLNGSMSLANVHASGDSLPLPVSDLRGELSVTPQAMSLNNFFMNFGESDIQLEGQLENYLLFLEENPSGNTLPSITGTYKSNLLNMDEMIDWEDESEDPVLIKLPDMNSSVTAEINRLLILGLEITDISGKGGTTPSQITLEDATATLFGGTATGNMIWDVPSPDRTSITFSGGLEELTAEAFFRDTGFLGEGSTLHEYLSGSFSADINYSSELDEMLSPDITTTDAEGTFGMTRARLSGHPIQQEVADFLKTNELASLALDEWTSTFSIKNDILTFSDLNITSEDIGIELNGTQHMITDKIDYRATLSLPERFKRGIASVLPDRAVDALQRDDGIIAVPIRITGTSASPRVGPDDDVIKQIIEDYLKDKGGDLLDRLFGGNGNR